MPPLLPPSPLPPTVNLNVDPCHGLIRPNMAVATKNQLAAAFAISNYLVVVAANSALVTTIAWTTANV